MQRERVPVGAKPAKGKSSSIKPTPKRKGTGFEVVKHSEGQAPISLIHPSKYGEALRSLRTLEALGIEDLYLTHASLFKEVLQLTPAQIKRAKKAKEKEEKAKKDAKKS